MIDRGFCSCCGGRGERHECVLCSICAPDDADTVLKIAWSCSTPGHEHASEKEAWACKPDLACIPGDADAPSPAVALTVTPEQSDRMAQAVLELLIETQTMPREERCTGKFATRLVEKMLEAAK